MVEDFQYINGPNVPETIKPMTELHDKLVKGYNEDKELQVPKLINSVQKRIQRQIEAMVEVEGQLQVSNSKLLSCIQLLKELIFDKDIPTATQDKIIARVDDIHKTVFV